MKKKKSGKRIFAIVLLVVIGIGGFYFGYDIGRMDHDEERIRAELKKTTADSEISIPPDCKGWYWKNGDRNPDRMSGGCEGQPGESGKI